MSDASGLISLRAAALAKFKLLSTPSREVLNPPNLYFTKKKKKEKSISCLASVWRPFQLLSEDLTAQTMI